MQLILFLAILCHRKTSCLCVLLSYAIPTPQCLQWLLTAPHPAGRSGVHSVQPHALSLASSFIPILTVDSLFSSLSSKHPGLPPLLMLFSLYWMSFFQCHMFKIFMTQLKCCLPPETLPWSVPILKWYLHLRHSRYTLIVFYMALSTVPSAQSFSDLVI